MWQVCFALILLWSTHLHAQSRIEVDAFTKQAFQELHFFAEGRGMMLSPGLISAYNMFVPGLGMVNAKNFKERWGVVYNDEGKISGLNTVDYKGHQVGVMGCVACHSGRAAGQFIVGLGNKNIDVFQLGKDVSTIEAYWKWMVPWIMKDRAYIDMEEAALNFSQYLSNPEIGNLTQGLVPISFIRGWFYRIHQQPLPSGMNRGQVKVPFLWGYAEKRKAGQFCDGFGEGDEVGWAVAVELAAGQSPQTVRRYYSKIKAAEESFAFLLPPRYPFELDEKLAARGKEVYAQTCVSCHGEYERDEQGQPIYKSPRWVPLEIVQTDDDRVAGLDRAFNLLVESNPLKDILRYKYTRHGYFAPRLDGVWSRFPYLHNGSVPTIADLLSPASERPKYFSLRRAGEEGRFDRQRIGLNLAVSRLDSRAIVSEARQGARDIYDTNRIGHSNQGHEFYTDLDPDAKKALLEYLKTL